MLRQLVLNKKKEQKRGELDKLREKDKEFKTRASDLEKALEEAESPEDIDLVDQAGKELETEKAANDEEMGRLEREIEEIDRELLDIAAKEPKEGEKEEMGQERTKAKEYTTRAAHKEYFTREVVDFYNDLKVNLRARRANGNVLPGTDTGAELIIPDIVVNRIRERIGDYTTLYPLVDKVYAKGRVKLILDVDTKEATWIEQRGASLAEDDDTELTAVEFDGFMVGRIVYIDNSLLEDSQPIINLDDYLTKRIARSIAMAVDKAIAVGEGASAKQPEGILTKIPTGNKATVAADYKEIIPLLGKIDTGNDATGEIVAVMHRKTYYGKIATLTLHTDAAGKDVVSLPNLAQPNFLGLRVVFNNYIAENKLIFGVFDKYTLVERESPRVDASEHVKFRDYQTAIRGLGRYDGKPVMPEAFVEVTLGE